MSITTKELANVALKPLDEVIKIKDATSTVGMFYEITYPFTVQRCTNNLDDPEHQYRLEILAPGYHYDVTYNASYLTIPPVMHQQNYFKLLLVISGHFYQIIEGKKILYAPGSYCLMSPNIRGSENFDSDYQVVLITMLPDFVERLKSAAEMFIFANEKNKFGALIEFMANSSLSADPAKAYYDFIPVYNRQLPQQELQTCFDQMISVLQNPESGATFHLQYLLCKICSLLENPENYHMTKINLKTNADMITFSRIAHLLQESSGKITRAELANLLKFSESYLSHIVKKHTGMSLSDYRLTFRLAAAKDLLENTTMGIIEIMQELNCTNRTFFYRIFKEKYGTTPSIYRHQYRNNTN